MQAINADVTPMYAVSPDDAKLFIKWVYNVRKQVQFDMDTLNYPRSCMTRATSGEETIAMIPLQPVLMFESLVHNPELTARQTAMSLWKIGQEVERIAKDTMHREAYFVTNSDAEANSCANHGWTIYMYDPEKKIYLMKKKFEAAKYRGPIKVEGKS